MTRHQRLRPLGPARWLMIAGLGLASCTGNIGSDASGGMPGGSNPSGGTGTGTGGTGTGTGTGAGTGTGGTGSTGGTTGGGAPLAEFSPAIGSLKRLTATQFQNTMTDLLGPVTIGDLEPDTWSGGFATVGAGLVAISPDGVEKYGNVVDAATTQVFADTTRRNTLLGCTPKNTQDTTCFRSFVTSFGRLAWRQPLTPAQADRFTTLASTIGTTLGDAYEALRQTTNAILLSPYFLYRLERGAPATGKAYWQYSSSEIATRLAYFLTNSTPDKTLLDAADQNALSSTDAIQTQAQRLLGTTQGRASIGNFAYEYFQLNVVAARAKDSTLFPQYTPALQAAMIREVPSMFESLVFDQNISGMDLFTTKQTFVNKDLASLYGLSTTGLTTDSWTPVTLPDNGARAGLLGTGAFLSLYANQKKGSPTTRGKFIRQAVLCQTIPDPPANVVTVIADPPPGVLRTRRQELELHRTQATCSACHSLMDPVGLPLENFDAIGAFRATDQGQTLDLTGTLDGVDFNGPIELGQLLSKKDEAANCMVRNIYRYATGHVEGDTEEVVISDLSTQFQSAGQKLRDLMLDVVTSDGFRYVAPATP